MKNEEQMKCENKENKDPFKGCLAGSVVRACDSWSGGYRFEPNIWCKDCLKKKNL